MPYIYIFTIIEYFASYSIEDSNWVHNANLHEYDKVNDSYLKGVMNS